MSKVSGLFGGGGMFKKAFGAFDKATGGLTGLSAFGDAMKPKGIKGLTAKLIGTTASAATQEAEAEAARKKAREEAMNRRGRKASILTSASGARQPLLSVSRPELGSDTLG